MNRPNLIRNRSQRVILRMSRQELPFAAPPLTDYGELKLLPLWDPLRRGPQFEKIVAAVTLNGN